MEKMMEKEKGFYWEQHAEAEKMCLDILYDFKRENSVIARFEEKLIRHTSSLLLDCVDHLIVRDSARIREKLAELGFERQPGAAREAFRHQGALLPGIVLAGPSPVTGPGVAVRVESIADFLQANRFRAEIEGSPKSPYRRALVGTEGGISLLAVERRASSDYEPLYPRDAYVEGYLKAVEMWKNRPRAGEVSGKDETVVFKEIFRIADYLAARLGPNVAAHIVCRCERRYWLSRNLAGRVQQSRQDTLGIGWPNHDHYTFRSSRHNFFRLVNLFSKLGFQNRERFYAGEEAGWGAQIMENYAAGLTLFLDVDLAPGEAGTDFSRQELQERDRLGTVGLWCALHGDSILDAGLHHLAARFDSPRLIEDMTLHGIEFMAPFSNFPYLKQAFSVAERWEVDPARVEALVGRNLITDEQGERFVSRGAVGSHLEDIERREGYKGFNKKNVSSIIRETDPRR
ncbi:MAG TPA: hypothetical protein VF790_01180 [Dissulfurispiraceae bacterium]